MLLKKDASAPDRYVATLTIKVHALTDYMQFRWLNLASIV